MHTFGRNYGEDGQPQKRAGEEVAAWFAAERADLDSTELPEGPDDFALSVQKWLGYVPQRFWPFVATWVAALGQNRRQRLSAGSLKALRGMMRRDVDETSGILWDAKPAVVAAWVEWYPQWVEGLIAERAASDPWFLLPAEEHYRRKQAAKKRLDVAKIERQRDMKLAAALFAHGLKNGGLIHWKPADLAQALTGRTDKRGGRTGDPMKVAEMAAALVRLDVAEWARRDNGKPWALRLTASTLMDASERRTQTH